jgi:hypothetical protein
MQFDNEIVYRKIGRINQIFKNQLPKTTRKSLIVSPEILNFASNGFLADLREYQNTTYKHDQSFISRKNL